MPRRFASLLFASLLLVASTLPVNSQNAQLKPSADVDDIAASIKKGNDAGAAKQAQAFAKKFGPDDAMGLFKLRKKGGFGIGPDVKPIAPDGIEQMLRHIEKIRKMPVGAQPDAFEEMAWRLAALAEATKAFSPNQPKGKKNKAAWDGPSDDLRKAALDFRAAVAAKNDAKAVIAVMQANATCTTCHSIFRE